MQLLDHVSITVRALDAARPFYSAIMSARRMQVDAFFAAGLSAGGKSEGAPGLRSYHPGYYAAFLLDPEGNKVEAVFHRGDPK